MSELSLNERSHALLENWNSVHQIINLINSLHHSNNHDLSEKENHILNQIQRKTS